jgi:hypothetical protein
MTRGRTDQPAAACSVAASETIELAFYNELAPGDRRVFDQHAAWCGHCRRALEEMSIIGAALAARPVVASPPGGDWAGFMSRLDAALDRGAVQARIPDPAARRPSYAALVAIAALLALVTINVVFVARSRSIVIGTPPVTAASASVPAAEDVEAFQALSEEHFERSKLVVLGLATKDLDHVKADDWTYERHLATSLLNDTRIYRLAAEQRGLRSLAGVMRDLELVLLQTSLTDETDPSSLAQIQRLIGKRDLLQKMEAGL